MAGAQQAKSQSCTTLKKTPLVYMASQTALICKCYAAECTKTRAKILQPENSKKEKNAPEIVRKRRNRVRFGCWRGWERLWAGANGWESLAIGQKDLVSAPLRSARGRAPLALARPSARGFGVDVGGAQQAAGERQGCAVLPAKSQKSGAGLVLRAIFGEGLCIDYHFFLRKKSTSARRMAKLTRITAG